MKLRQDNRGSSLIVVIIVIAFVSLMISTLFMMSVMNIQMKGVDRESKKNFYSAEGALEQITVGLQKDLSEVSAEAYILVMQQYANKTLEIERRQLFNATLLGALEDRLETASSSGLYNISHLEGYLSPEIAGFVDVDSATQQMVPETDSLVLKDLEVTFTDASGYQSIIETDIRLTAPNLNLVQPSDMPDLFEYSIIANEQLVAGVPGTVTIQSGVYAGDNGLTLTNGAVWNFRQASRVVVSGEVDIPQMASLTTTTDMDLWAREINVMGGSLTSKGRTYVSNDLILSNTGSYVTLEGEYYGYGNGEELINSGVTLAEAGDSSAILINGINSTLDMSNIRRLLLSGSAQIATGKVTFDPNKIENMLPENEPSINKQLNNATISSGTYYLQSVGNGKVVCSAENSVIARTEADTFTPGTGCWEMLSIIYNSDGTVSLMDQYNHKNKYISVQTEDQNMLVASADEIGIYEKFYPYVYTVGNTNYYALKSYVNGKFVSIDTYYPTEGDEVTGVLCANRDKVSDAAQLFLFKHYGSLPMVEEEIVINPTVAFTYENAQVSIEFGHNKWDTTITDNTSKESAKINYEVYRDNSRVAYGEADMSPTSASNKLRRLYYVLNGLEDNDVINYTITYTVGGVEATTKATGSYTHNLGKGNSPTDELEMVDGIYFIRCMDGANPSYIKWMDNPENTILCGTDSATESDGSWEEFILVNNHDGTISFKSIMRTGFYLSVQEDGSIMADTESTTIGINEKFRLEKASDTQDCYRLQTVAGEGSNGNGKYVYVNRNKDNQKINSELPDNRLCVADANSVSDNFKSCGYFSFNWLRVTSETGTQPDPVEPEEPINYTPITSMEYKTEESADVSFTSAYWTAGNVGTVKLHYTKNLSPLYPEIDMTVSGTTATAVVEDLHHQDKITYYFTYTYVVNGETRTVTTPSYIYIHETVYGEMVNVDDVNENVNLGESLEVKSNQIAYLVPPECIGVFEGETYIGKNPMSDTEFTKLIAYVNNTSKYPGFEMVSFTKTVEGLGTSLEQYRTPGTDGFRTIFVPTTNGTMVYFYVDFDSDNTSAYFRDYYSKNQSTLEAYMKNYVNEIRLSNYFTRLTTNGNMVYSMNGSNGRINLHSNEGSGANLDEVQLSGLRNEEEGYQKRYKALTTKLMLDYDELTTVEKNRNLFDNLIKYSEAELSADSHCFAGLRTIPSTTALSYPTADGEAMALMVHNSGVDAFHYNDDTDPNNKACLILATGDVVVEKNFKGIIIARGTVTIKGDTVDSISGNQQALFKVLKCVEPLSGKTILEHYFRDGDKYVLDDAGTVATDEDYATYADLVTYEDWTKK